MELIFRVAKYNKEGENFIINGYDEYTVTFLKGLKTHQFRVCINGRITTQTINIISFKTGYRDKILSAIGEYVNAVYNESEPLVKKKITLAYIGGLYSKTVVNNIKYYLLNIGKCDSRDELTKYGLIGDATDSI